MTKEKIVFALLIISFFANANDKTSLGFIENKGQIADRKGKLHPEVFFMYKSSTSKIYFEKNKVIYFFQKQIKKGIKDENKLGESIGEIVGETRMDLIFENSNPNVKISATEKNNGYGLNYFLAHCPNGISPATYKSIIYKELYPFIDLIFKETSDGLKYDIVMRKGANIDDLQFIYDGAKNISIKNNKLSIVTELYNLEEEIPTSYINDDERNKTDVKFVLDSKNKLTFEVDRNLNYEKLVIDPTITWLTLFEKGVSGTYMDDFYSDMTTDVNGNTYVVFSETDVNMPVINPGGTAYYNPTTAGSSDIYLAKFDSNRSFVWGTYYGGTDYDTSPGATVLTTGNGALHLLASVESTNAPMPNAGGGAYYSSVGKVLYGNFNLVTGNLYHATKVGGLSSLYSSIAVSSAGTIAIAYPAYNFSNVPLLNKAGAYNQATNGGFTDIFFITLNTSLAQTWGTYLGGAGSCNGVNVTYDSNNNLFFVAEVGVANPASTEHLVNPGGGAYYQTNGDGSYDLMIGKFNTSYSLVWNTLYGGNTGNARDGLGASIGNNTRIRCNSNNDIVLCGGTGSTNFPVLNPGGGAYFVGTAPVNVAGGYSSSDYSSFILKFSNAGVRQWATYWGDNNGGGDMLWDIAFDNCNNMFALGLSSGMVAINQPGFYNNNFPFTSGTSNMNSYLMKFNNSLQATWASYLGDTTGYKFMSYIPGSNRLMTCGRVNEIYMPFTNPGGGAYYDAINNSSYSQSFSMLELNTVPVPAISGVAVSICSGSSATLTASFGIGNIYNWYTVPSGGTAINTGSVYSTPVLSGNTIYYVSSSNGTCVSDRAATTVSVSSSPTIAIGSISSNTICSGQAVTITPSGGSASNYTIFPGSTSGSSFVVSPTSTTTYTIKGANASGCVSTASSDLITTITVNLPPTITTSGATSATICSGQSFVVTPSGGGTGTYTLTNTSATSSTNFVLSPTSNTTYTIIGANSNGCVSTSSTDLEINITVNTTPTISIGSISSNVICSGQAVTITPNGGSASNYTIFPSNTSGSSFVVSPTATTTYTIKGANASGCISSASSDLVTTITVNATPTISTTGATSGTICSGQNFNISSLSGSGTGSYTLVNTGVTSATNFNVSPTTTTTYTINGANSNGCISNTSSDLNVVVTVNSTPTISTTGATSGTICSGQNFNITALSGSGTGSYTLVNTGATSATNFNVSPTTTTTYTINGANSNGCISSTSTDLNVTITVNTTPTVNATFSSNALCSSQNVTITLAGANGTYTLIPGSLTSTSSFVVSPPAGTTVYTVIANNTNGCVSTLSSQIYTTSVSVVTNPTITASFITNTICAGSTATITPFGANTFTLLPNNISVASGGSFTLTPTVATTYTVNGTATGGCVSVPSTQFVTTIGVSTTPTISLSSVSPSAVLCSGQSATLTVTGAVAGTYTILNTGNSSSPLVVTPLTTTTYTIVGAATNGCVSNASTDLETTITVNQSPILSISSQQNVLCFGNATGSVNVTSSGGTGATTITPITTTNLSAGTYSYITIDALGCSSGSLITISQPTSVVSVISAIETGSNSNCVSFTGSASVSASGGTGSLTVLWNGGAQTGTLVTGLNTGLNTFTITDANGCSNSSNTGTITINGVTGISTNAISQTSVNCTGLLTGAITFTTTGGGPDSYTLTNLSTATLYTTTTGVFTGLSAGSYSLSVIGNGGCSDAQLITISEPTSAVNLTASGITTNSISCFGGTSVVTATATGGVGSFTYTWSGNTSSTNTASYVAGGPYTVTVIDGNNCTTAAATQTFSISQPTSSLTVTSIANTTVACHSGTTAVTALATGGTGLYIYQWQLPSTSNTNTATYTSGTYTMTVTDINGCASAIQVFVVSEPTNSLSITEVTVVPTCVNQSNGKVEISVVGGTPSYTILWSNNATSFSLTNLAEGILSSVITDANGCIANYSITIEKQTCIKIVVNNILTPNGDGKNETFVISGIEQFPNNKLEIYNRWGSLIYSKAPYDNTFNGSANVSGTIGTGLLPSGTYFIVFDFGDGETPIYKGYLELKY